jgi:hypothetical protein
MMYNPPKKGKDMKKPFDEREKGNTKKSFSKTEKSVDAVAKDTNKTRRKNTLLPLKNAMKKKTAKSQGKKEPKSIGQ